MYTRDLIFIFHLGSRGCSSKPGAEQKMLWVHCCHRIFWSPSAAGNNARAALAGIWLESIPKGILGAEERHLSP